MQNKYLEVYEAAVAAAKREKIPELPAGVFTIQTDALARIREDDEPISQVFASMNYIRYPHDRSLAWFVHFYPEACLFSAEEMEVVIAYEDFKTPKLAGKAIFDICKTFLNGQMRVVLTLGNRRLASELFYVHQGKTVPLAYRLSMVPLLLHPYFHKTVPVVLQNRCQVDQTEIPQESKIFDPALVKAYEKADRIIDWAEPEPMTYQIWQTIENRPRVMQAYIKSRLSQILITSAAGLFCWQSIAFLILAFIFLSFLSDIPVVGSLAYLLAVGSAYAWFASYALPKLLNLKSND